MDKKNNISRKQFMRAGAGLVATGAVLGAGVSPSGNASAESTTAPAWGSLPKVDVHHHIVPADYVAALASIGIYGAGGGPFPTWTAAASIAMMDANSVSVAMLSLSSPGVYFGDPVFAATWARQVNVEAAAAVQQYPTRFGFFACLPLPTVADAIAEATYAIETLNADGIVLLSNINNIYVGDPSYDPLMSYLDSVSARVFIHPNTNPLLATIGTVNSLGMVLPAAIGEFVYDTTRAVHNLLFNGVTAKFPNIKFILAHAGGTVPYIAGRTTIMQNLPTVAAFYPNGVIPELQKFYYDTTLSTYSYALDALDALVPRTNILFGSDFPFAPPPSVAAEFAELADPTVLKPSMRVGVANRNATTLFPRLKSIV